MRLQNNLYHITHIAADTDAPAYTIALDGSHPIYQAHFPGEPITPGVCIIQIAKELLEHHLSSRLDIVAVKNAKFLSVISPDTTPEVTYVIRKTSTDVATSTIQAQMTVEADDQPLAKISLRCTPTTQPDGRH